MTEAQPIHFIPRNQLNPDLWNTCVDRAPNGLIYAYTTYLDRMAPHWDGLVLGNYTAVMPLTWNSKYGIPYLYQPFLAAQLGVFGPETDAPLLDRFLEAIPRKFRYWDIYLNAGNQVAGSRFPLYRRTNFVLSLQPDYAILEAAYRENIRRNVRKALHQGCYPDSGFEVDKVITLAMAQMNRHTHTTHDHIDRFRALYADLRTRQMATTYGIFSAAGELLSSAVFFFSHRRAYYILVGNHPNGRTIGASHALIDAFIRDHAGQNRVLDFEGSDLPNLAFFYSGFGATTEDFAGLRVNRLPFYLRWLKS